MESSFHHIEAIFQEAISLPQNERDGFVKDRCGTDQELYAEVMSLIRSDDAVPPIFNEPVFPLFVELLESTVSRLLRKGKLGKYKLENLIGQGGIGAVFLGLDPDLNRKVAIKILPYLTFQSVETILYFKTEALAVSGLSHPGIVHIYEFSEENGVYYIVMEYVEGLTVRQILNQKTPNLQTSLNIVCQLIDILIEVHKNGIIHRDLKPENMIYNGRHLLKLLDFGSAMITSNNLQKENTLDADSGTWHGTIAYLPPEYISKNKFDTRSDYWSLGVILYELLTGKNPFRREKREEMIGAILTEEPPLGRNHKKHPKLGELQRGLFKKNPRQRMTNGRQLRKELQTIMRESGSEKSG